MTTATETASTQLVGAELLALLKEMPEASKSDLVRAAGYVSTKKDGTERLNFTAFYEAILNAKGLNFNDPRGMGVPGRQPSFCTRVHFNGNLLVGKVYTSQMGLKPGDEFEIKISKNQIRLIPVNAPEEEVA